MTKTSKKEFLKRHANRNITYILDKLGISFNDRGDGIIQSACPCLQHGGDGDNNTAWSWRIDIGRWVCWSHHCEESRGTDIFALVSSVKGTTFPETLAWIEETLENNNVDTSSFIENSTEQSSNRTLHIHDPLSEDNLKFLDRDPQYLLNRDFDREVLREHEVGLWTRAGTYMHDRVVFPVRDHDNYLVGYTGRTIHGREYFDKRKIKYSKWVHGRHFNRWPQRGDLFTSSILYNLNRAKRYVNSSKKIILVEGPLDGMRLQEAGIYNWVATLGTNFHSLHRTLLINHGFIDLYVAYDNDDPDKYRDGQQPSERAFSKIERIVGDLLGLHQVILPPGHDCGDLSTHLAKEIFQGISV